MAQDEEWKVVVDISLPGIGTRRASRRGGITYAGYNIRLHNIEQIYMRLRCLRIIFSLLTAVLIILCRVEVSKVE